MTANPDQPAATNPDAVAIDVEAITGAYQQELTEQVQRRILAEAMVQSLKAERAELRLTIQALSAGAPTTDEG